jgi:hypothetical protein
LDFKKEFGLAFGDYVEAYEGTTNRMTDRSTACIALSPTNNSTGAWLLWKLSTRSRIRRTNWVKMVTTPLIADAMNAIAREDAEQAMAPVLQLQELIVSQQSAAEEPRVNQEEVDPQEIHEETQDREREQADTITEEQDDTPELIPQENEDDSDDEAEDEEEESRPVVTTRSGREIRRPSRFVGVTRVARSRWDEQPASEAVNAELTQMFVGLQALKPVDKVDIAQGAEVLNSHMFVVEKHHANGEYDKTKARLVADGRDQDPSMFPNKSSPTVAIHSVFTVLGLVAALKWLIVVKIDIKGAFLQTPMTGDPIYMKLDPKLTKFAINLFPDMQKMVDKNGCIYARMLKAIYGCVHASALWYMEIKKFLEGLGYVASETDRCVFRKRMEERIFILLLYVDDILALVDEEEAEKLRAKLQRRFGELVYEVGRKLSYLGMEIEVTTEGTRLNMIHFVEKLLEDMEEGREYESPGTKDSFVVDETAKKLNEADRKDFHSKTAKLLYLAKRARPDILTVAIFLCTRVQGATVEDKHKLVRVLGYLRATKETTLLLRATGVPKVTMYVDAAYAIHNDSKSHSGVIVYVGQTLAYVSSRKQKCMSKSPTEAELIALTDNVGLAELFREFVEFLTMKEIAVPIIYEDCNAVVSLVTVGGGVTRTKHLRARMFLGKEMVDEGRLRVIYKRGDEMEADGFSKPYDPAKHKPFATRLLGSQKSVNGWALNGVHNNKSEDTGKKKGNKEGGEQKVASVGASIVGASILPDSGGSKQQKAKKKGPTLEGRQL